MKNTKKKFLKLSEYPGGKEAFKEYVKLNLNSTGKGTQNEFKKD